MTGAARGIGRATTVALVEHGWIVWASDVDGDALEALATEHGDVRPAPLDVTDTPAVAMVGDRIARASGSLDALVTSAAVFPRRSLAETTSSDVARVLAVNVVGTVAAVLAARSPMRLSGGGAIVLMTSGASGRAAARSPRQAGFADYGASKAALERWALGVCDELAATGIALHLLCPGAVVATPGVAAVLDETETAAAIAPHEVARAILRLCRRTDPAVTGRRYLAIDLDRSWS